MIWFVIVYLAIGVLFNAEVEFGGKMAWLNGVGQTVLKLLWLPFLFYCWAFGRLKIG